MLSAPDLSAMRSFLSTEARTYKAILSISLLKFPSLSQKILLLDAVGKRRSADKLYANQYDPHFILTSELIGGFKIRHRDHRVVSLQCHLENISVCSHTIFIHP